MSAKKNARSVGIPEVSCTRSSLATGMSGQPDKSVREGGLVTTVDSVRAIRSIASFMVELPRPLTSILFKIGHYAISDSPIEPPRDA